MKKQSQLFLIPLTVSAVTFSCSRPCSTTEDVVCQTYVHRYGVEVPSSDWTSRGESGQVISTLSNGVKVAANYGNGIQEGETTYTFPHRETIQKKEIYAQGSLIKETLNNSLGIPVKEIEYHSPTHVTVTTWYENGTPRSEEEMDEGLLVNGDYFNPQHQLEARVEDKQGTRIERDAYGQLVSTDTIADGEMVLQITYHANGTPQVKTPFQKGTIQGKRYTYYPTAEPNTVEMWRNGKQEGMTEVFQNGEKIAEIPYAEGMKEGIERRFGENGVVVEEISWHYDQRHGPSKTYVQNSVKTDWFFKDRLVSKAMFDQMSQARN